MSRINETDVQQWRKIMNRMLAAEELLKDIECIGKLPGNESDRIRTAISTVRGNRRELEDRFEYEKDLPAKSLVDDEREKVSKVLEEMST